MTKPMRATVAKRLRRKIYGKGHHPGPTIYYIRKGVIIADDKRQLYQTAKKEYNQ
jgi:hypothetical protein